MRKALFVLLAIAFGICAVPAAAQKVSVKPGINKRFENPNVAEFVGTFEREGRDAFDHKDQIVGACKIEPGMTVADVGAGTGLFTREFAGLVGPKGRVYAVDISDEFVQHIEKAAKKVGRENVVGVVCRPDAVNLPDASVDLAFICDTYHHFEFPERTMTSVYRALKPGGALILIDFHRIEGVSSAFVMGHVRAGQEVFVKEITACGFRQVDEQKDMLKESYFIRFEKVPGGGTGG
ncbi:MAG: class I SAM-dependent methyltransferase [Pirellulales bacterium]